MRTLGSRPTHPGGRMCYIQPGYCAGGGLQMMLTGGPSRTEGHSSLAILPTGKEAFKASGKSGVYRGCDAVRLTV